MSARMSTCVLTAGNPEKNPKRTAVLNIATALDGIVSTLWIVYMK